MFFNTQKPLHREASTHSKLWHKEAPRQKSFYTQKAFTQLLHISIYTAFTHSEPLRREAFTHGKLLHSEAFTHSKLSHKEAFVTVKPFHREAFTQRSFFTHRSVYTQQTFTERSFYRKKLLHREAFTHRSFYTQQTFTHSQILRRKAFAHRKLSHTSIQFNSFNSSQIHSIHSFSLGHHKISVTHIGSLKLPLIIRSTKKNCGKPNAPLNQMSIIRYTPSIGMDDVNKKTPFYAWLMGWFPAWKVYHIN